VHREYDVGRATVQEPSSVKKPISLEGIPGIPQFPGGITPEIAEFFSGLIETFNRSAAGLQEAYVTLQEKFDRLNLQLEDTNRNLTKSLDEQERLSNYLTNILESLTSGVLVIDTEGIVTLFNRGAETITGISVDKALGRQYSEIMGADTPEELTPLRVLVSGEGRSQMEKTVVSTGGETIPVGFSISPLLNSSGNLTGAVEIFMDLSRIKALEDEISRMDKLAALGQMSATMAHKIRNPLGGVVGYTGLIGNLLDDDHPAKKHVGKIIEGVEKINHIISSVLAYNALPALKPRPINLAGWIAEHVEQVKHEMSDDESTRIGFSVTEPAVPVTVEADPNQLSNALHALFRNAIEAIEDEGTIYVRIFSGTSVTEPSCPLTSELLETMRNTSRLLKSGRPCGIVTITDSGAGMDEETRRNLFIPFFTTKEKGIGLSLASAGRIIEAHHGEIHVESTVNFGTALGIIVPVKSIRAER